MSTKNSLPPLPQNTCQPDISDSIINNEKCKILLEKSLKIEQLKKDKTIEKNISQLTIRYIN
jgi:hypothetical protein